MSNIDIKAVVADAITLAKNELGKSWKKVEPYAEHEFSQFAASVEFLTKLSLAGKITTDEFKARLEFQKTALNNVLRTIEGIGIIAAQNIVNGILGILSKAITTALGLTLPI